jgi:F-type H+-transporting ATPase subunit delta
LIAGSLAKRYAKALADVAAASGELETVRQEVRDITDLLRGHRELSRFLANPSVLRRDKAKAFEGIVGRISLRPLTVTFLRMLLTADRLGALESIVRAYEALVDERLGRVKAEVTTAVALDGEQQEGLRQRLEQVAGKRVYLEVQQDPKIMGGLVAQIGSQVYDGSLKMQLARLRERLSQG